MIHDDVLSMIGQTPHVKVRTGESGDAQLHVKLEGYNPTGSIKDRACVRIIRGKLEDGSLRPSMTLLDASSGNMACAIAFYGNLMGYRATVAANAKLTGEKRKFLLYYGATVHQVGNFTIDGNRFCRELAENDRQGQYCFLDQLHNWDNPRAYYETLGPEILADFPHVTMVVGSLGSGGSLLGAGQFLKERKAGVKIVAVQAAPGTRIPGTGAFDDGDYVTPFIQKGIDEGIFDHIVKIREEDAIRRSAKLRDQGIFAGLQTGGVLHASLLAVHEFGISGDVVLISGDTGWKNLDKLLEVVASA